MIGGCLDAFIMEVKVTISDLERHPPPLQRPLMRIIKYFWNTYGHRWCTTPHMQQWLKHHHERSEHIRHSHNCNYNMMDVLLDVLGGMTLHQNKITKKNCRCHFPKGNKSRVPDQNGVSLLHHARDTPLWSGTLQILLDRQTNKLTGYTYIIHRRHYYRSKPKTITFATDALYTVIFNARQKSHLYSIHYTFNAKKVLSQPVR